MYSEIFVKARLSITAPMKFRKSVGSPTLISSMIATTRSFTDCQSDRGTYTRLAAEHFCPWYS